MFQAWSLHIRNSRLKVRSPFPLRFARGWGLVRARWSNGMSRTIRSWFVEPAGTPGRTCGVRCFRARYRPSRPPTRRKESEPRFASGMRAVDTNVLVQAEYGDNRE